MLWIHYVGIPMSNFFHGVLYIRDARTPQPGKIIFNTMRYRSGETVKDMDTFRAVSVI